MMRFIDIAYLSILPFTLTKSCNLHHQTNTYVKLSYKLLLVATRCLLSNR